jgi:hypothetical protein
MQAVIQVAAQLLGPLIGITSLIAGCIYFKQQRKYMKPSYEIVPSSTSREGEQVSDEDIKQLEVRVHNAGTQAEEIPESSELQMPVTLDFGEDAQIVKTIQVNRLSIDQQRPAVPLVPEEVLKIVHTNKVVLQPIFLNRGQAVSFVVALAQFKGSVEVDAHMKDVDIVPMAPSSLNRRSLIAKASFLFDYFPILSARKSPLVAALITGLTGLILTILAPFVIGLYFRSFLDFLLLMAMNIMWIAFVVVFPQRFVTNLFGVVIAQALYAGLRAYNSNQRISQSSFSGT